MDCPFCNLNREILAYNASAFAVRDAFPVSEGHTLVIPKAHESSLTSLSNTDYSRCFDLVRSVTRDLQEKYEPDGFNIGVNIGEAAGQTVSHAHIHVIPRYQGDVSNPRGGVRGVIPEKADY